MRMQAILGWNSLSAIRFGVADVTVYYSGPDAHLPFPFLDPASKSLALRH
jgi:hypothetical protein